MGLRLGDRLNIMNSFSGYSEGVFVDAIWKSIPEDNGRKALPCVIIASF